MLGRLQALQLEANLNGAFSQFADDSFFSQPIKTMTAVWHSFRLLL